MMNVCLYVLLYMIVRSPRLTRADTLLPYTTPFRAEEVRAEVRSWLALHWDPEAPLAEWRSALVESGWACPAWPVDLYGRGLPPELARVATDEVRRSEEHTSELQSLIRTSYAVFCLQKKTSSRSTQDTNLHVSK